MSNVAEATETVEVTKQDLVPAKKQRKSTSTPESKQASTLRRDAAMLEKYAPTSLEPSVFIEKAKLMRQQADKLAPTKPARTPRPMCANEGCGRKSQKDSQYCFTHTDKLQHLSAAEWDAVSAHFLGGSTEQFQRTLLEGFSWKRLKQIAAEHTPAAA